MVHVKIPVMYTDTSAGTVIPLEVRFTRVVNNHKRITVHVYIFPE